MLQQVRHQYECGLPFMRLPKRQFLRALPIIFGGCENRCKKGKSITNRTIIH